MAVFHLSCFKEKYPNSKAGGKPSKPEYKAHCALCGKLIVAGELVTWPRRGHWHKPNPNGSPQLNVAEPEVVEAEEEAEEEEAALPVEAPKAAALNDGIGGLLLAAIMPAIEARLAKVDAKVDIAPILADIMAKVDAKLETAMHVKRVEVVMPDGGVKDVGVQHKQFPTLVKYIMVGVNVWIAGPAGSGKTTAVHKAAEALGKRFFYSGAISDGYALTGYCDAHGKYVRTLFREAWENGGVFLLDEIDGSDANATLTLTASLANGHAVFPDAIVPRHPDCVIVAAANTWGLGATHEYVGRLKLDAAFLDRFVSLNWEYDDALETSTCGNADWAKRVQDVRSKVKAKGIRVLVTPRASYFGARLLAAGVPQADVEAATLRKGMTDEQWNSIRG